MIEAIINFFKPSTVSEVLKGFNTQVAKLEELAYRKESEVVKHLDHASRLQEQVEKAEDLADTEAAEAERAKRAAFKIKDFIEV